MGSGPVGEEEGRERDKPPRTIIYTQNTSLQNSRRQIEAMGKIFTLFTHNFQQ